MLENSSPTWIITGTTGIGAATVRLAARRGVRVFIVGIDEESGSALAEEIVDGGGIAVFYLADLTISGAADGAAKTAAEQFGRIDALFNVAGISGRRYGDGPVHECTDEGWDVTLDTNARTMFEMCRAVLRIMLAQPLGESGVRGSIVNTGSVLAVSPQGAHFATHAYAASKGAIQGMSRAMAAYYAPHGIRVNVLAPGLIRTPMSRRAQEDPAILDLMKTKQPLGGDLIDADDVARTACFLLSDASRRVTGETVTVDGGWSVSG